MIVYIVEGVFIICPHFGQAAGRKAVKSFQKNVLLFERSQKND